MGNFLLGNGVKSSVVVEGRLFAAAMEMQLVGKGSSVETICRIAKQQRQQAGWQGFGSLR